MRWYIKYIYLGIFIIGIVMIFSISKIMLIDGFFSDALGLMESSDKRIGYALISLFGLVGFFIEIIFEKINNHF